MNCEEIIKMEVGLRTRLSPRVNTENSRLLTVRAYRSDRLLTLDTSRYARLLTVDAYRADCLLTVETGAASSHDFGVAQTFLSVPAQTGMSVPP